MNKQKKLCATRAASAVLALLLSLAMAACGANSAQTTASDNSPGVSTVQDTDIETSDAADASSKEQDLTDRAEDEAETDTTGRAGADNTESTQAGADNTEDTRAGTDNTESRRAGAAESTLSDDTKSISEGSSEEAEDLPSVKSEALALLRKAISKNLSLSEYRLNTVTTVTYADNKGETSAVTELNIDVTGANSTPQMAATGEVRAFEQNIPLEMYYFDGNLYQNMSGTKLFQEMGFESAIRAVSGNLLMPDDKTVDTVTMHNAGDGKTKVQVRFDTPSRDSERYVEYYINSDNFIESQHLVNSESVTEDGSVRETTTDKWVTLTSVGGDVVISFPDFTEYTMNE